MGRRPAQGKCVCGRSLIKVSDKIDEACSACLDPPAVCFCKRKSQYDAGYEEAASSDLD